MNCTGFVRSVAGIAFIDCPGVENINFSSVIGALCSFLLLSPCRSSSSQIYVAINPVQSQLVNEGAFTMQTFHAKRFAEYSLQGWE